MATSIPDERAVRRCDTAAPFDGIGLVRTFVCPVELPLTGGVSQGGRSFDGSSFLFRASFSFSFQVVVRVSRSTGAERRS